LRKGPFIVGAMFASRLCRATNFLVGISIKDIEGCKAAVRKAISMAQKGDRITAVHIPKVMPDILLTSITDPDAAGDEAFLELASLPSRAGDQLQKQIKEVAESHMCKLGKDLDITYKVSPPSRDGKSAILELCKSLDAHILMLGPGVGGNGSLPPFVVQQAKGFTVCVVRDNIK